MQIVLVLLFVVLGGMPAGERKCSCVKADDNAVPHGANEIVEYKSRTLKSIHGTVTLPNGEPVNNAVVEVYESTKANKDQSAYKIATTEYRRFACLPDQQGHFCLSDLPSGRYVLRIGTLEPAGVNEVFLKVRLERSWWTRWFRSGKPLKMVLTLGW